MDYRKHDFITGAVSHLPHVISASLVNLIKKEDTPDELMKTIAAGGFKDITRISSSSPVMWQQICLTNRENILVLLDHYITALQNIRKLIDDSTEQKIFDFFIIFHCCICFHRCNRISFFFYAILHFIDCLIIQNWIDCIPFICQNINIRNKH